MNIIPFYKKGDSQKGFIISLIAFFILIIMTSIAISMASAVFYRQKIASNSLRSTQSYYAAESGTEDSLLLLKTNPQMAATAYSFPVNGATANVTIPTIIGGSRVISSLGSNNGVIRTVETTYSINNETVSFHYAAQIGVGGLNLNSNSQIVGNVFAAGNISGGSNSSITDNVVVAGNGNSINGVNVGGDVRAYSCLSSAHVDGNLTYVTGGTHTCSVGGTTSSQSNEIANQQLPISDQQIQDWKDETAGGTSISGFSLSSNQTRTDNSSIVVNGNVTIGSSGTWNINGSSKIIGNLTINSNATVKLMGTMYVTGLISIGSNSTIKLDSSYYGNGGLVIADGNITVNSNATLKGTCTIGPDCASYMLVLSTSSSVNAISIGSNASGAIFYASSNTAGNCGGITVNSNALVRELTACRVSLGSNAQLEYQSGLVDIFFSTGPGGGWQVSGWGEK